MDAHEAVKRGDPGARETLFELQRQYRMGQFEIVRTPRGATAQLVETHPRRSSAKRAPQPKPKRKRRSTEPSQRPSWWLGEDESWRHS
jgi:hypothetical protein